jgi:uncharacterized spore protein YtfJ
MGNSFNVGENVNAMFEKLENFLKTKTVVGEPIKIGETTLVPFINISFGIGGGGGAGNDNRGNVGDGGGLGTCAKVAPTAVLVIQGDKVELLPIKKFGGLDKLLDMVPGIIEKIDEKKNMPKEEE